MSTKKRIIRSLAENKRYNFKKHGVRNYVFHHNQIVRIYKVLIEYNLAPFCKITMMIVKTMTITINILIENGKLLRYKTFKAFFNPKRYGANLLLKENLRNKFAP